MLDFSKPSILIGLSIAKGVLLNCVDLTQMLKTLAAFAKRLCDR